MGVSKKLESVGDFYEFFEAIPDEKWMSGSFHDGAGRCCALGHLGVGSFAPHKWDTNEERALCELFYPFVGGYGNPVPKINDGKEPRYNQPTPKARILAALNDAAKATLPNLRDAQ